MEKSLTEMTVQIAIAQASHATMSAEDMDRFLETVFRCLKELKASEEGVHQKSETEQTPPVDPSKSIQRAKVICLECGRAFRQLTNAHLRQHGLTSREYKKKWGIPLRQALAARSLSARRSRLARERGLGSRLRGAGRKGTE